MKTSHTPGPWHISAGRYINNLLNRVAKVDFAWQSDEEQMANIHLIAAAPDLLAACEQALKIVDAHRRATGGDGDITAALMRSTIAKAKGAA